ncbi:MAG: prepilin-type N-terminal cleavage/methylation domain-containing protein [Candidatus Omnitrophica bacterium]|nr:prepilin-type N-terminal cleavage/methylation domain-containing protein [Candidatus Omnitrophota bacterium]
MRAFTLVEVLIVALIFSFLALGITQVVNLGNVTFPVDLGQIQLQQQTRQAMQWMTRELRQASGPVTTGSNRITFNSFSDAGLTYYLDTADANGDGLVNQILREFPAGTRRIMANNISSLTFTCDGPPIRLIRIDVAAGRTILGRALDFSLTEQVRLRNE